MANLNKVLLMGNLTRDPELKFTPQGTAVCKFSIAVNRAWKAPDGEMKKDVQFFNIATWTRTAENCGKFLKKGSSVLVEGRLENRSWEKDGVKRTATEVVAENVQFLTGAKQSDAPNSPSSQPPLDENGELPQEEQTGDVPF